MTRKAHDIGMTITTFKNASGLPDPEQTTTARDMLTLALHLRDDFPRHYELFSTRVFNYGGDSYRNHNGLLGRYRGTDGIKTGYTRPPASISSPPSTAAASTSSPPSSAAARRACATT